MDREASGWQCEMPSLEGRKQLPPFAFHLAQLHVDVKFDTQVYKFGHSVQQTMHPWSISSKTSSTDSCLKNPSTHNDIHRSSLHETWCPSSSKTIWRLVIAWGPILGIAKATQNKHPRLAINRTETKKLSMNLRIDLSKTEFEIWHSVFAQIFRKSMPETNFRKQNYDTTLISKRVFNKRNMFSLAFWTAESLVQSFPPCHHNNYPRSWKYPYALCQASEGVLAFSCKGFAWKNNMCKELPPTCGVVFFYAPSSPELCHNGVFEDHTHYRWKTFPHDDAVDAQWLSEYCLDCNIPQKALLDHNDVS